VKGEDGEEGRVERGDWKGEEMHYLSPSHNSSKVLINCKFV
jgi:hypothetical protein